MCGVGTMGLADLYVSRALLYFGGVEAEPERAALLVLGAPYDATSSYRPGSRLAPRAIREAAASIEFYSLRAGIDLEDYKVADLGDVVLPVSPQEATRRLEVVVTDLIDRYPEKLMVVLGGEHSITLGVFKALAKRVKEPCLLVA
ncbi:MAG TPA: agmatinase, partial [Pyrodictium sp.]|nr:agmatinase [Pyrodictium sp.]